LPHWRQESVTYFVTFRLADALPQSKLRELAALREQWLRNVGVGQSTALSHDEAFARAPMERVELEGCQLFWIEERAGAGRG